jgi:hypothetical protein
MAAHSNCFPVGFFYIHSCAPAISYLRHHGIVDFKKKRKNYHKNDVKDLSHFHYFIVAIFHQQTVIIHGDEK